MSRLAKRIFFIKIVCMAKRTNDLTEFAKIVADKLAARCGSLKKVLSAGIMALDALSAEEREKFMAAANGVKLEPSIKPAGKESLQNTVVMIKEMTEVEKQQPGTIFRVLDLEEQKILDEFRKVIDPDIQKQKKKTKRG